MKKLLSILLVIIMLCSTFAGLQITSHAISSSGSCGTNVRYTFDSTTGLLTISGSGAMNNYSYYHSPFYNQTGIKTVVIENGVTSIGNSAFYGCSGLTSITIPNSVTSIGYDAFSETNYYNDKKNWVNNVLYINHVLIEAESTIAGTYQIKNGTICIADSAFSGCSSLTRITIPNSVTSIGEYAFRGCSGLTNIDIPDSVTSIGESAFSSCSGLTSVTIGNSVTSIGSSAFYGCSGLTSITIPNSVTSIGSYAFSGCSGLSSVTISDSVTSIGDYAFSGCSGLTGITIPNSVTSIGNGAFSGTNYYNDKKNWVNNVLYINHVLIKAESTIAGTYQIKNGTICIADSAFSGCSSLTSINIPDSVTSIGDDAFYNCWGITSVTIGNYVTSIGSGAFFYCSGLQSISIPDSVTSIGGYAFKDCSRLTSVTIPNSVTSIGSSAFEDCRSLTSVTIGNSVTSIGDDAFEDCWSLTSITIPNSVTSIGSYAFQRCYSLNTAGPIGSNCNYEFGWTSIIPSNAFCYCSSLISITIPATVTSLEQGTFSGLSNCKKILILGKTTNIKNVINNLPSGAQLYVCHDSAAETVAQLNNVPVLYIDENCAENGNHIPAVQKYLHNAATCTETGEYYYDCLLCGKVAKTEVIPALGHQYKSAVTTNPTCTEHGIRTYICTACSDSYTEPVAALGHKWNNGTVTTEPTCTKKGIKTFTCTVCEANRYEDVAALGHVFKIVNHEDGSLNYVYCERSKTETVNASLYPQSEHNYANNTNKTYNFNLENATKLVVKFSASTKVENLYDNIYLYDQSGTQIGKYTGSELAGKTITVNGDKFSVKLVSDGENTNYGFSIDSIVATISLCDYHETEHTYNNGVITNVPNCVDTGIKTYTCYTCGYEKKEVIPANGHTYATNITGPTCTEKGYTTHTCTVCGHTFNDSYTDMVPHSYADEITEPTCTEKGYTTHTCSVCGDNFKDAQTNALGHSYKRTITKASVSANGKIVSTCVRCGQIQTEVIYYPKTITISKTAFNYNKKVQKPTVSVKDSNGKAISANNYTLTYSKGSKNVGKYAVKVTFKGNYSGSKTVYYYIRPVVSPSSKALYMGQTLKIKTLSSKACTFASSNKKVATVDKKGVVKAQAAGTATIVVKANGVGNKVTIKVAKPCLTLNKTSASIYIKGKLQLKATTKPGGQKVKWSSSNTKVATVNSNGVVVGIKAGKANITATYVYKGKTYKSVCKIIIKNPVLNDSIITLYNGWSYTLSVIGGSGTIKWSSSNQKVAMVNSSGKVVGNQMGVCYVYATRNGFKMKCKVTVSPYNKECMYYFAFKYGYSGYGFLDIGAVFGAQPLYSTIRNGSVYYSYYISDLGTAYWRSTFVALLEEEGFYYYQGFYINGSPGEVGTKMIYLTTSNGVVNIQYSIYPF